MKIRESGMPAADVWNEFFDPDNVLEKLHFGGHVESLVEFGCGYGTFTIPAARRVSGRVYSLDIEADMIAAAQQAASQSAIANIDFIQRDFIADGTGLPDASMDYAMVFNILHHDQPVALLREARRNLKDGGRLGIIHWNFDAETPRGPPMDMRPRPAQCLAWALEAGFRQDSDKVDLPPYHYGYVLVRDDSST